MTTLVIANMDDELMSDLCSLAASNRMTAETQARLLLRRAVPPSRPALIERLDSIAAMTPPCAIQSDAVALLREDRDR